MADKLGNLICPVAVSSSALKLFAEFIHLMGGCYGSRYLGLTYPLYQSKTWEVNI